MKFGKTALDENRSNVVISGLTFDRMCQKRG